MARIVIAVLVVALLVCAYYLQQMAGDLQVAEKRITDLETIREKQRVANLFLVATNSRLRREIANYFAR